MSSFEGQDPFNGSEIAIIGMACRVPKARTYEELWRNLKEGVEGITFFSEEEIDPQLRQVPDFVPAGGVVEGLEMFDASFFGFTPREAEITDPQHRFFFECAWEALEDAGCNPETYKGAIGVYAGLGTNTYLFNLFGSPEGREAMRRVGDFRVTLGNSKDHLPTWTSYVLNLRGPSVNVNTACSTSLVAVHMAAQSLLNGECDVAMAGGVTLDAQFRGGYVHRDGGIESPDGHCRTFDAQANGTVPGNGVGVVVLKRLADAIADGDRVHAVLKGSAINNDGSFKVGYTAPSVEGQALVIREALAVADVDPETITYVEAHGTATALGDPIEIRALTEAFRSRTEARGFCGIGSVKSNVGHLDAAAGVTGLIKTALALEHGLIPPSLHFESPNPQIDFDSSPFYVVARPTPWGSNGVPRRAGVSSFGIGGTNAHVILEEAPAPAEASPSRPAQLLVLSARTASALDAVTSRLVAHLESRPELDLPDVVFTLQTGRKAFQHRRMVVCRGRGEAIEALGTNDPTRVLTSAEPLRHRPVAFLFPGQGSQYAGMARGLYETEPVFREEVDRCLELVAPHLGFDLREVLFPADGDSEEAARKIEQTAAAQAALFVVEYALARLWMAWGITPGAMMGHSIGEYVAACLAGVFSLEDALAVVAARGRLMQGLPGGSMLAVHLDEAALGRYLEPGLDLAGLNGPALAVVSGPEEAVSGLERRLAADGVRCQRLHTSHAFHSEMMEPVLDAFRDEVAKVRLSPPEIPVLSNLTGTWLTADEATDPGYWAKHLRGTVRFAAGIAELLNEPDRILLEVGPGRTLSTLARQNAGESGRSLTLTSLRHPQDGGEDLDGLLKTLGRLWLAGVKVDWEGFYSRETRRKVTLPTYPFERKRYWIERAQPATEAARPVAAETVPSEETVALVPEVLAPERSHLSTAYVEAGGDVELRIIGVWRDMMGVDPIGAHDNFFELGGHSLLLIEVVSRLRKEFGVELSMRDAIEHPTPARLAGVVTSALAEGRVAPVLDVLPELVDDPANRHEPFPLTEVQEAYWLGRTGAFEMGQVATHGYTEIPVLGLDVERLTRALHRMIGRHEMLRAIVLPDGSQRILPEVPPYRIAVYDLRGLAREAAEAKLLEVRGEMSHQVLPPDRWPLFDLRVTQVDERRWLVHVSLDMLIADAWSIRMLNEDAVRFYIDPDLALPPIRVSFRDYVLAETAFRESETYLRSLEYWRSRLPSLPGPPELPLARDPATLGAPRFVRHEDFLLRPVWRRLKERCAQVGVMPSSVLLAIYADLLTAWSKSPRFLLNLTLFQRLPLHADVYQVIGDFTSLTLLEVDNSVPAPFQKRALRLQDRLWEDLEHRYVSGIRVVREITRQRGAGSRMVAPVVFTSTLFMNAAADEVEDDRPPQGSGSHDISQTPQVWLDMGVGEQSGHLRYSWDAVDALFPPGLLREMFAAFGVRLRQLAEDDAAWQRVELGMVPADQLALRAAVNDTAGPLPQNLLHELPRERAARQPDRPAVVADRTLTYRELSDLAAGTGRRLRELGVRPNELVAVVMEKGWEQVAAVLGILEAGAAYLPIDPTLPAERLAYLLHQGKAGLALTQPWLLDRLEWPAGVRPLALDETWTAGASGEPLAPAQRLEDLAYVIFTSGSTGLPKGVMIDHLGAANTVLDVNERFGIGPDDRVLALSALNFDLSVYDIFGVLAAGGTIVLPDTAAAREPRHWADLMAREAVTVWNSVPALMAMLVDFLENAGSVPGDLRLVMLSGDWIPTSLPGRIRKLWPQAQVISLGGATEASIWSILYPVAEVDSSWTSIPYGKPMRNQGFQVLNETLEPVPVWVPGQLYISGVGLAKGYWADEEKTAASFIVHPRTGERLYRTGDLGRYLPDGNIEFLGREDFQVKVQGYRIELGEIEAALDQHPFVSAAAVTAIGEPRGEKRLVAYVVPSSEALAAAAASPVSHAVSSDVVLDPIARLEFKAQQHGLRRDLDGTEIVLARGPEDEDLVRAYAERRSYRRFARDIVPLGRMSEWLRSLSEIELGGKPKFRYPSAGGLYPVQAYVYVKDGEVESIPGGTYYYDPKLHRLIELAPGARIEARTFGDENAPVFEQSAFALFLVVDHGAIDPLYGNRARDFSLLEAGYMGQLLMSAAPAFEIGLCPVGGLDFDSIRPLFALGGNHEFLHALLGGFVDPRAAAVETEQDDYQLFLQLLEREGPRRRPVAAAAIAPAAARTPGPEQLIAELRAFLADKLPEYMVPASFMVLEALPLTANGKVDRKALPKPADVRIAAPEKSFVVPRDPVEEEVAALWCEVLGLPRIGVFDDFFEAGGHSLLAARLIARVRERLGVELSLASLFEAPNVAGMAALVDRKRLEAAVPLPSDLPALVHDPERLHEPFPLTDLQQAYWVGGTGAFVLGNLSPQFDLEIETAGLLPERLELALRRLVERHDMLRAVVLPDGRQQILPDLPPCRVEVLDLRGAAPQRVEEEIARLRREMSRQVASTAQWPLFDVRVCQLDGGRSRLLLCVNLLICDAWSTTIFGRDLTDFYRDPEAALPPLGISFRDYVLAVAGTESSPRYQRALDYWRGRLDTLPPGPELPLAQVPDQAEHPGFVRRVGRLDQEVWRRFRRRATETGVTPDAALCAVYCEVLARWSKRPHFTLNVLYFNRLPVHPDVSAILANFSSTILLEVDAGRPEGFAARARRIQEQLWRDLEHSQVSGVRVVRELSRNQGRAGGALVPVVFASTVSLSQAEQTASAGAGQEDGLGTVLRSHLQTPQVWLDHQVHEDSGGLVFNWDSVERLFPVDLVQEMFDAYTRLLEHLGAEEATWREAPPALIPAAQLAQRAAVNDTVAPLPDRLLHAPLADWAAATPDAPAVISAGRTLTYAGLYSQSCRLGRRLREAGARPNRLVAVVMEKGWEQVVAVSAVLASGAAYLPIDPELPAERLQYLLRHSEVELALTQPWIEERLDWPEGVRRFVVDGDEEGDDTPLEPVQRLDDLAYVIFTSGSTGLPKGVMIDHLGAANTIADINRRFAVGPQDRVLGISSLSFDLSVYDVFGMLAAGGAVVLPEPAALREPGRWAALLQRERVTVWSSVPALMEMLVDHLADRGGPLPADLRLVMMSGDWIPVTLPGRIRALRESVEVVSLGGATEASIWSIGYPIAEVGADWKSIPYGKPLSNQQFHVLEEGSLEPCPIWVTGQLYIGGVGLAKGYLGDEEKTAASFILHPKTGERLYRTGDLGRYLPDGNIEFLGREDLQVKIQGYRIELGEIEAALARHPTVRACVAVAVGEMRGSKSLKAYVVPEPGQAATAEELREFLHEHLPAYMVPRAVAFLDDLPLSANGKVDRGALERLDETPDRAAFVPPRDEVELQLVRIWEEILEVEPVGVDDSFFDLGGHSLLAVRLMSRIQQTFGRDLPLSTLFEAGTVAGLAALLRDGSSASLRSSALVPIQPRGTKRPFFWVHPVGGNVLCYVDLARQLDPERPFYGLQVARPEDREELPSRVEEMAAHYLAEVRKVQEQGPFLLGGWSMGGVVAFEMAQQLREAGEEVEVLALVDAQVPSNGNNGDGHLENTHLVAWFAQDLGALAGRDLGVKAADLRDLDPERQLALVLDRAKEAGVLPADMELRQLAEHFRIFKTNAAALHGYRPSPYPGRLLLLRADEPATTTDNGSGDETLGWGEVAEGGVDVCRLPGNHYTIVSRPHVERLAGQLRALLS